MWAGLGDADLSATECTVGWGRAAPASAPAPAPSSPSAAVAAAALPHVQPLPSGGAGGTAGACSIALRAGCAKPCTTPAAPPQLPGVPQRAGGAVGSGAAPHCVGGRAGGGGGGVRSGAARCGAARSGGSAAARPPPAPSRPPPELHQTALGFMLIAQRQDMARVGSSLLCIQQPSRSCHTRPAPASSCCCCCCCRDEPRPTPEMRLQDCGSLTSPQPPLPSARLLLQLP